MDQSIFASLSHTHYWYEVGMLKVPYVRSKNRLGFSCGVSGMPTVGIIRNLNIRVPTQLRLYLYLYFFVHLRSTSQRGALTPDSFSYFQQQYPTALAIIPWHLRSHIRLPTAPTMYVRMVI